MGIKHIELIVDQTVYPMHIGNLGHLTAKSPKGPLGQMQNTVKYHFQQQERVWKTGCQEG